MKTGPLWHTPRQSAGVRLSSRLRRKGKRSLPPCVLLEKELVRTLGSLFRQDELQTLYPAGLVQNRDNQTPVFCPAQSYAGDLLPLQVRMPGISEQGMIPDACGQLCGRLPAAGLLRFLVRPDSPEAFAQSIPLGGGQFFLRFVCPCPSSPVRQFFHQSEAGTSENALYAPSLRCGLPSVPQRCRLPSISTCSTISPAAGAARQRLAEYPRSCFASGMGRQKLHTMKKTEIHRWLL